MKVTGGPAAVRQRLARGGFGAAAMTLIAGAGAGQLVGIVTAPVITRLYSPTGRYLGGERPAPRSGTEAPLAEAWSRAVSAYEAKLDAMLLHEALAALWGFVGDANRFVEAEQPWAIAKAARAGDATAPEAEARLAGVLGDLVEAVRLVALAAAPFMPTIAPRALAQLGYRYAYEADGNGGPPLLEQLEWGAASAASGRLGTAEPLFPRLEVESAEAPVDSTTA